MDIAAVLASYDTVILALTLWREARGESKEAVRCVYHVINNRKEYRKKHGTPRWPTTFATVCLQKAQFSCFNADDPNNTKWPVVMDMAFIKCLEVISNPGSDPTNGATHYYSPRPKIDAPKWAKGEYMTHREGAFVFFRLPE